MSSQLRATPPMASHVTPSCTGGLVQPAVPCTKVPGQRGTERLKCSPHSIFQAMCLGGAASASGKGCFCLICRWGCVEFGGSASGLLTDIECDKSISGGLPPRSTGVQSINPSYIGGCWEGSSPPVTKSHLSGCDGFSLHVRHAQRKSGSGASAGLSMVAEALSTGRRLPGSLDHIFIG